MNKLKLGLVMVAMLSLLNACGRSVEVPPASVGFIISKNGVLPDPVPTSKFRLSPCFKYCDELLIVSLADSGIKETMPLFMPKDKLKISVDIRATVSIPQNKAIDLTTKVTPKNVDVSQYKFHEYISPDIIYATYGKQAVRGVSRGILAKYSIQQLMENRDAVSREILDAINSRLAETKTSLTISRLELADIRIPDVITKAQEAAAQRRIEVEREKASIQVRMLKAEGDLKVAKAERAVQKEQAMAIAEQNKIAAKSVTTQLLKYRQLEAFEKVMPQIAKAGNLIVVPIDMGALNTASDSAVLGKVLHRSLGKH